MKNPVLINIQIALFFKGRIDQPNLLFQGLNEELGNLFGIPMTIPLPGDPQFDEVPIIQVTSSNGVFQLNLCRKRADFFVFGEGLEGFDSKQNVFFDSSKKFVDFILRETQVKRFGFVSQFFFEDEKESVSKWSSISNSISEKFINLHHSNEVKITTDSFIRYSAENLFEDMKYNNSSILQRQNVTISGSPKEGVVLTRDFNTFNDFDYSDKLGTDKIISFIKHFILFLKLNEFKKIIYGYE